jgi:uncharacterized small protein (DUF1192 family)
MGLLHKLLAENKASMTAECGSRPDMPREDLLLLRVQELQARVAEMKVEVEAARAQLRELSRLYS